MKCKKCGHRWTLEDRLGPGGSTSPGQSSSVALGVFVVATIVFIFISKVAGIVLTCLAFLVFGDAILKSGYQEPATAYDGSYCPECNTKHWIWPWNF